VVASARRSLYRLDSFLLALAGSKLVSRGDWFRSTSWSRQIEQVFLRKLSRSRNKSQYLRIQASTLVPRYPRVALRLLDQYFALGEQFDMAQAHVDRAAAYLELNQIESAVAAYEAALAREAAYPNVTTQARLELPFLIAAKALTQHYDRALELLESHKDELVFPLDRFRWNCAFALIRAEQGPPEVAREAAKRALAASAETSAGFRYHPHVGLVGGIEKSIRQRLSGLAI
jgi:tetratricopeptide (TPR) repeat protein